MSPSEALVLHVPLAAIQNLLEVDAVARRLSVSPEYVRRLIRDRVLPAIRLGQRLRVEPRVLEAFLEARKTDAKEA